MREVRRNAYQEVQTPWFNSIPEEWSLKPIKAVMNFVSRPVGENSSELTLLSLTQKGVIPRDVESGKGKYPSDFSTYQIVNPGDLIFCLFDIDETPRAVGLSDQKGMVTGAYSIFKAKDKNLPVFLSYLFHWIDDNKGLKPYYTGLRKVVRPQTFGAIKIPVPPIQEQAKICNYLDCEISKIDALINEQIHLIDLLQEKRQAVISHAVAKGLNPNANMKDSGVEWLGEVPEHWEVKPLKRVGELIAGFAFKSADFQQEGVRVLKIANIQTRSLDLTDEFYVDKTIAHAASNYTIQEGDLLFALTRPIISSGIKAAISTERGMLLNQRNAIFRLKDAYSDSNFIYHLIFAKNFETEFNSWIDRTGQQPNISTTSIGNISVSIPPREERAEISRYLDNQETQFDSIISSAQIMMSLLKEKRSALISAAVTGQIDVRGLAPEKEAA